MNAILERPAVIVEKEFDGDNVKATEPVGNDTFYVFVDFETGVEEQAEIALMQARQGEPTEPMDKVFSDLGIE